jgi:peptidyl-prolyl cis-trans isomerase A (cyclophilin A)
MRCRSLNLVLVIFFAFLAWGCKKQGASTEANEADKAVAQPEPIKPQVNTAAEASAWSSEEQDAGAKEGESDENPEDVFVVKLETTKGDIVIDVHKKWAPLGAERFRVLVSSGYYNDAAFFRVMANFMAQTGLSGDPKLTAKWQKEKIKDDPRAQSNLRGMVTFANSGPDTRTTQFFINLVDNAQLDSTGFVPFGKVRDMTAVDALYSGYGEAAPDGKGPKQADITKKGNKYLKKKFPDLDYIKTAIIVGQ